MAVQDLFATHWNLHAESQLMTSRRNPAIEKILVDSTLQLQQFSTILGKNEEYSSNQTEEQ
jgi:hypothetical protein